MLSIIFWILWILCLLSALVPVFIQPAAGQPTRMTWLPQLNIVVNLILLGILGFKVLKVAL
jgi:hypothetical protein